MTQTRIEMRLVDRDGKVLSQVELKSTWVKEAVDTTEKALGIDIKSTLMMGLMDMISKETPSALLNLVKQAGLIDTITDEMRDHAAKYFKLG